MRPPATDEREPYRGSQPVDMRADLVVPDIIPADERIWVPLGDGIFSRPLQFNVTSGQFIHLLRVTRAGIVQRHRHAGPVQGYVLKGRWHYLEHDWHAIEGSFVYEPPGETHTLVVPEGCDEMLTIFHVTGALIYVDPDGNAVGYDDVFRRLELTRAHYGACGLGEAFVDQFVR